MTELPPITHLNQDISILKVVHLRGSIFLVAYINALIEMVDFSTPEAEEPLDSFQILEHINHSNSGEAEEDQVE